MDDWLGYRAILACKPQLVLALKLDILSVTDSLEAEGLIIPGVIVSSHPDHEARARQLVEHILDRVKLDPACYGRFVQVVSRSMCVGQLISQMLQTNYSKYIKLIGYDLAKRVCDWLV